MRFQGCLILLLILVPGLICNVQAYHHYVGGKHGWILHPSEDYDHWAQRSRFQVGDTLYFQYNQGSDSVLEVTKEEYDACNTKKAMSTLTDGHSIYKFMRSGPFYFISGNEDNCKKGEKLVVVVMAERHRTKPKPISPIMSPAPSPPSEAWPPQAGSPGEAPTGAHDAFPPAAPPPAHSGSGVVSGINWLIVGVCTTMCLVVSVSLGVF